MGGGEQSILEGDRIFQAATGIFCPGGQNISLLEYFVWGTKQFFMEPLLTPRVSHAWQTTDLEHGQLCAVTLNFKSFMIMSCTFLMNM